MFNLEAMLKMKSSTNQKVEETLRRLDSLDLNQSENIHDWDVFGNQGLEIKDVLPVDDNGMVDIDMRFVRRLTDELRKRGFNIILFPDITRLDTGNLPNRLLVGFQIMDPDNFVCNMKYQ